MRSVSLVVVPLAWMVAALLTLVAPGLAQDFGSPSPPGPGGSACAFLERGLPQGSSAPTVEACFTRWFSLPGLETRAVACGAGWRMVRAAAGVSQTGEPEIGWNAAGLACGVARSGGGAGLRAVGRRDRLIEGGSEAAARLAARAGVEVGGGAWLTVAGGLGVWAAVPQAWIWGAAPPLDRPLEVGAVYEQGGREGLVLWLVRGAPTGDLPADHGAGAALRSGPLTAWGAARDRPLRGSFGLAARAGPLMAAAEVESHPDLGETVRLSVRFSGAPPGADLAADTAPVAAVR